MFKTLKKKDRILSSLAEKEVKRQKNTIDLIASENIAPQGVLELLGSELTNKYSEGYPGKRYYPGNVYYDQIEELAKKRALKIFRLSSRNWHVNVQAYSGAVANLAVYLSVLKPGETILSMNLTAGGHLSHGSKVSFTGKLFNVVHYGVDKNYDIDYGELEKLARKHKPKMIISGASAYPKKINFEKIGKIAKKVSAYHLADISHYAGLVSAGYYPYPFKFSDFVMTTTHKSLFGPRAALIYISKNSSITLEETTQEQCVEVSKGIGSLFGLTQKECFEIKIPEQIITNALVGGGSSEEFFSDERLKNSKLLIIEAESLKTPESLEDLQDNYLLFETKELGVSLL